MSLAQIVLTTNKTTSNVGDYVRKIGQGERGQVLPVIVVDATGTPYDLSDKKIVFSESKDSGKYVVDDGKDSRSGKFTLLIPKMASSLILCKNKFIQSLGLLGLIS